MRPCSLAWCPKAGTFTAGRLSLVTSASQPMSMSCYVYIWHWLGSQATSRSKDRGHVFHTYESNCCKDLLAICRLNRPAATGKCCSDKLGWKAPWCSVHRFSTFVAEKSETNTHTHTHKGPQNKNTHQKKHTKVKEWSSQILWLRFFNLPSLY